MPDNEKIQIQYLDLQDIKPYLNNPRNNLEIIKRWEKFTGKEAIHEDLKLSFEDIKKQREE